MSIYKKDNPAYLEESISSMLCQTYPPEQFVIVKDGPLTEGLELVLKKYTETNLNLFTIVENRENLGLGRALDMGIKSCRNELVARMDADDISLPTRCEKEVKCFNLDMQLDIVGTYINEFYEDKNVTHSSRLVPLEHGEIVKFARRRSPFNHPTVMYKKSAVLRCGGYGATKRKEDLFLFTEMVNNGCKAKNIPEALLLYRSNPDNLKRRKTWTNCKEYIEVIYGNYKKGYSSFWDLLYVIIAQLFFFLMPVSLVKIASNVLLRSKPII